MLNPIFYTIYKIVNLVNDKEYIGKHITSNLYDSYMGSGINIKTDIKKYGVENFYKEILFIFDNVNDMNLKEKELVDIDYINNELTYNIAIGGGGGGFIGKTHTELTKISISKSVKDFYEHEHGLYVKQLLRDRMKENNPMYSEENKIKVSNSLKEYWKIGGHTIHSPETSKKTSNILKNIIKERGHGFRKGKKNSYKSIRTKTDYKTVTCPHCNKSGKINAMKRWHFNNCKLK